MRKIYPLFLLILLILFSCISDFNMESDITPNPQSNFNFGNTAQRNFQGLVLSTNGSPISGATVSIGTSTVQTNSKGLFIIKNAEVKENFAFIKVTKAGYINASRTLVPTNGNSRVNIMMIPAITTTSITSGATATVSLSNGTKVKFDGSFNDASGNAYSGNVDVALFHLSPSNQYLNELMPGSFLATNLNGNSRVMETYGMLHVQLTGSSGQNLQIATGHTAEITVPLDAAQLATSPNTIPLWSFSEITGMWQEEGSATKVGNTYVGNVSHFSWWNCDAQFPQAVLKVTVKNAAGQPLSNAMIGLKRNSQTYESYGITDGDGMVSGVVPAGEPLELKIYDNCNTVVYSSTVGPFPVGATTVLPDISLTSSTNQYTIKGTLKTCSGADVTDGFASLRFAGAVNYFQTIVVPVTNGTFSINSLGCSSNQQFVLEGIDITNIQTSGEINFTGTAPITNLGDIVVCNTVSEFISYKVDNQATRLILSNISVSPNLISSAQSPVPVGTYFRYEGADLLAGSVLVNNYYLTVTNNSNAYQNITVDGTTNQITFTVTSAGAVGTYTDFTFNGTYTDSAGASHTVNGTGHVKRDY
ncbi:MULTISPECIES: carboxypeptidase-like regulatory domain-containing protein [Chryseobacterium]|uniref:carboxypeptidase-like regulatory domain-containing protein n=1 Tax=Chryseobacterium TaxID=59732 RepID=UPI001BE98A92|nr:MULTISPECIES: carboxypeptidase-like regulatory domain-containing protein [Chryseobacterium]MBT2622040.1 hypothetical protein [Chryseobacterium sp. ISL-6]